MCSKGGASWGAASVPASDDFKPGKKVRKSRLWPSRMKGDVANKKHLCQGRVATKRKVEKKQVWLGRTQEPEEPEKGPVTPHTRNRDTAGQSDLGCKKTLSWGDLGVGN